MHGGSNRIFKPGTRGSSGILTGIFIESQMEDAEAHSKAFRHTNGSSSFAEGGSES